MAYDEDLAERIRELVAGQPGVTEQKMFGGLAFLIGGNMAIAANAGSKRQQTSESDFAQPRGMAPRESQKVP